jgi:transmembrane sensor
MAQLPDTKRLQQLARKFLQGTISDAEQQELDDWFLSQHALRENPKQVEFTEDEHRKAIFDRIQSEIRRSSQQKTRSLWPRIAAAASVLILLSVGGYFLLHKKQLQQQFAQNQPHDIAPGKNQATLILANGSKILLSKGLSGTLAQQGNMLISVNNASALTYTATGATGNNIVQYNTLSTTRGEESPYPLVLADGTKVWLNAASSITFPTAFNGRERKVKITGEAYFEVKHNAAQPFRVETKGQTIEDIGTEFDVNAYDDEPVIKTTLVSGSVKVSQNNRSVILKPGEAAVGMEVKAGNTEQATAWKKGLFSFKETNIEEVMRQLSRWYDVQVNYPQGVPHTVFTGEMHRDVNASQVLDILGYFKVHFQIVAGTGGKQIIVKP